MSQQAKEELLKKLREFQFQKAEEREEERVRASLTDKSKGLADLGKGLKAEEAQNLDDERRQLLNHELGEVIKLRKQVFLFVLCFVVVWMVAVFVMVWVTGAGCLNLSDTVLGVLLGTTTANIVGLLALVVRFLFPPSGLSGR